MESQWQTRKINVITVRWRLSKSEVKVQLYHGAEYTPDTGFLNYTFDRNKGLKEVPFSIRSRLGRSDWFATGAIKYQLVSDEEFELTINMIDGPQEEEIKELTLYPEPLE